MCAANIRRNPFTFKTGAILSPYKVFRTPSKEAVAIALSALPPAPNTPTTANCDAPVKVRSESKQLCKTEKPAATEAAPKAIPYAPTVRDTLKDWAAVARFTLDTETFCLRYPQGGNALYIR